MYGTVLSLWLKTARNYRLLRRQPTADKTNVNTAPVLSGRPSSHDVVPDANFPASGIWSSHCPCVGPSQRRGLRCLRFRHRRSFRQRLSAGSNVRERPPLPVTSQRSALALTSGCSPFTTTPQSGRSSLAETIPLIQLPPAMGPQSPKRSSDQWQPEQSREADQNYSMCQVRLPAQPSATVRSFTSTEPRSGTRATGAFRVVNSLSTRPNPRPAFDAQAGASRLRAHWRSLVVLGLARPESRRDL